MVRDKSTNCTANKPNIIIARPNELFIPKAFSPNGDNVFDKFIITNLNNYNYNKLEIYNRYGQLVFSKVNYNNTWDGTFKNKNLPVGGYIWVLETEENSCKKFAKGVVNIIR
jgi:gliding motility-associated-like protein